jgi:TATA-binding protein-associated factor
LPLAALALEALHKQVLPFLLRRLKEDVLNDLPPKIIQDYFCELSEMQKYLYDDFSKSQARLTAEDAIRNANLVNSSTSSNRCSICGNYVIIQPWSSRPMTDINTALQKLDRNRRRANLFDINHAPKLLALRSSP